MTQVFRPERENRPPGRAIFNHATEERGGPTAPHSPPTPHSPTQPHTDSSQHPIAHVRNDGANPLETTYMQEKVRHRSVRPNLRYAHAHVYARAPLDSCTSPTRGRFKRQSPSIWKMIGSVERTYQDPFETSTATMEETQRRDFEVANQQSIPAPPLSSLPPPLPSLSVPPPGSWASHPPTHPHASTHPDTDTYRFTPTPAPTPTPHRPSHRTGRGTQPSRLQFQASQSVPHIEQPHLPGGYGRRRRGPRVRGRPQRH